MDRDRWALLILCRKFRFCCALFTSDMVHKDQVRLPVMCTRNLVLLTTSTAVVYEKWSVAQPVLPEADNDLFGFVHIQDQVVDAIHQPTRCSTSSL